MAAHLYRLALFCIVLATPAHAIPQPPLENAEPPQNQASPIARAQALFVSEDQLLVEVKVGADQLAETLSVYSSRKGVYLPIGELARALDLAITVYPAEMKAGGWILDQSRTLSFDLNNRTANLNGKTFAIGLDEAALYYDDIYIRLDLMEKLLPVNLTFDARGLSLNLKPREPLPFQLRLQRQRRRSTLGASSDHLTVMKVETPYLAYTPTSFDVMLNLGAGLISPRTVGQYDLRAAGDIGYAGMQMFASSDQAGRLNDVRFTLFKKDTNGRILGALSGTAFELGDTFTPGLSLGARSMGGRGVFFSAGSRGSGSVFSHTDLRGELPEGWQVELYANELLQAQQTEARQGLYEFRDIPLAYGANTLRLVFYGPHGEQSQTVRHFNFGGGQLDRGGLVFSFGAIEAGTNLVEIAPALGQPKLRTAAVLEYGVNRGLTLVAGYSHYTPVINQSRDVLIGGLRTSLVGTAMQIDLAKDRDGGEAAVVNLAGQIRGVSFLAHQGEYRGPFYDENNRSGLTAGALLRQSSGLRLDGVVRMFRAGSGLPISLNLQREDKQDGSVFTTADARFSFAPRGNFVSSNLSFSQVSNRMIATRSVISGQTEASRLLVGGGQIRGGLRYQIQPRLQPQSLFASYDHALSARNNLYLSLSQDLSAKNATVFQIANVWRLNQASLSLNAGFDTHRRDARIGVQLAFGLMFDPTLGGYRLVRPGATSGGAAVLTAFVDSNGDGRPQPGEALVAGLPLESQGRMVTTDARGAALLTGLGVDSGARIRVLSDALDEAYTVPPADAVQINARPGRVTQIFYGLKPVGEVQMRLTLHKSGGERTGVAGLIVQLVTGDTLVRSEQRSEYDGTLFFEKLPPGDYRVRIEPSQAKRLNLALGGQTTITVPLAGGYVGNIETEVVSRQ